ncbi:MAG: efflux RND transporter periplasmic adaptor subunit [Phycisphaerae bacterium]
MRKKTILTVSVLAGVLFTGIAYFIWSGPALASAKETEPGKMTEHEEHADHETEGKPQEATGHAGHGEEKLVVLTDEQIKKFGIEVAPAGPGKLQIHLTLPGEVMVNADRVAHIVPRIPGVVQGVRKNLGDLVRKGEVLAVLESRELADAKAGFLAARERLSIAQSNFTREEQLWKKKISAEQEYLQARQILAEAKIELRSIEQKLHALGFSESSLAELPQQEHMSFTRYEMVAPFNATIIEKHLTLGEAVKEDSDVFTIADLSTVWATFNLHQKDMTRVRMGQPVTVLDGQEGSSTQGIISFVAPIIGEQTRTMPVRVVLPNPQGKWRPGLFVTGQVLIESENVAIRIPKEAVLQIDGKSCIFVKTKEGFEPQPVTVGRTNDVDAEIVSGLTAGQPYAAGGAYTLKLELGKFKGDTCGGH